MLVDDPVPALKGLPEPVHAPVQASLLAEEIPRTVAMQLRRQILNLFGSELTAIAAGSFVNKSLEALLAVAPAPVEETRARAACDVDDLIESVVDAVESYSLKACARRAVLFLEEGAMEQSGLLVGEAKLSCSHTTR